LTRLAKFEVGRRKREMEQVTRLRMMSPLGCLVVPGLGLTDTPMVLQSRKPPKLPSAALFAFRLTQQLKF
jgi:hypothetical protein